MKIIICDDDIKIIDQLRGLVCEFFEKNKQTPVEIRTFLSADELIEENISADIVFLDVEMPGKSGITAGAVLMQRNPDTKVFIVTSYPDYLDEAMRFHVFRYLSKPVDKNRLFRNLGHALFQYNTEISKITIDTSDSTQVVKIRDIVYAESFGRGTKFVLCDSVLHSTHGIHYWEEKLQYPCFYNCYRGILINMLYVFSCDKDKVYLRYAGKNSSVYLAHRKSSHFKATLSLFVESSK